MPEPRRVEFGGKIQEFPADATDAEISAALNAIPSSNAAAVPKARTWTDMAVDAIPGVLGTAGAIAGGIGGTAFGMGFGGVPGAAGGATLGTATGEAAKQLINRYRGAEAPSTSGEAATEIAIPSAEAGATTAALGAIGQYGRPYLGAALQKTGALMQSPQSVRQLAGQGVSAVGRAVDAANAPAATKMVLDVNDVAKIKELMKVGVSQGEAVRRVWNLKIQNILRP